MAVVNHRQRRPRTVSMWVALPGLLIATVTYAPVSAADGRPDFYGLEITPFAGYRFGGTFEDRDTGQDFDVDDNPALGLIINFPAQDNTEWEVYYSRQSSEVFTGNLISGTSVVDLDITYLQLGGTYLFDRGTYSQPYFVATAGLAHLDPSGANTRSDTYFSFAAGGGWKYFPDSRVGFRLDGRFIGTLLDSNSKIFCQVDGGGACVISTRGEILWQFELQAGVVFRF